MSEVKIAERITIDEPHNVEIAIMNLTGRAIDFELIQKFIVNEKNTMFYLNRKLNSSTEYGIYNDYLWLDTGIRDSRNNPIMICLHNGYDGFVGHYTGTVRELANIILETIASLNEINPLTGRLIQISRDGKITDDEIHNFALISKKLDEISLAIDSLNLWVDKTASDHKINIDLLNEEKKKLQ